MQYKYYAFIAEGSNHLRSSKQQQVPSQHPSQLKEDFFNIIMNSYTLVALACLVLKNIVLSLPTGTGDDDDITFNYKNLLEPMYEVLSTEQEVKFTEGSDEPVVSDDDDLEVAEILVFRPYFRYREDKAKRRHYIRQRLYYPYYQGR
ncbi:uncharacterized protein [Periplaneta americana]|uniref:uncharacterized protein n=1 Tax=Periplaneta americana TaxID=6978 RepID=UPI0037E71598